MNLFKKIPKHDSVEWHVLCASNLWLVRQANLFQQFTTTCASWDGMIWWKILTHASTKPYDYYSYYDQHVKYRGSELTSLIALQDVGITDDIIPFHLEHLPIIHHQL